MIDRTLLDELAALQGIASDYQDIWGNDRPASSETLARLLDAMGVDVSSNAAAREQVAAWRERSWRRLLPPVQVVRGRQAVHVPVTVPAPEAEQTCHWRLESEQGRLYNGELVLANLPQLGEGRANGAAQRCGAFELPVDPGLGYHTLAVETPSGTTARMQLIVCPGTCHVPPQLALGRRIWGLGLQLYALRGEHDWGMGDFSSLSLATEGASWLGADVVGVNPLHALFPHAPAACSPYSPSSRLFLNVLYIDPEEVPELVGCEAARTRMRDPGFRERLDTLRQADLVDYEAVAALKRPVLETLFTVFRDHDLNTDTPRGRAFAAFRAQGGEALRRHAVFEALAECFAADHNAPDGTWPAAFRDPTSPEVVEFAERRSERVAFFEYLQFLADEQLATAAEQGRDRGLVVGLYRDLAIGPSGDGAEVWSNPGLYARGVSVGAPPDDFNLHGQDWGLPPMIPDRLIDAAYAPFIAALRHNMRQAGALRIDHVMGLLRLFWVPEGMDAEAGAYVHYPMTDLLGILALESQRNRCMVVGEDLGTVPDEVRAALAPAEVQSYRVLYFEREEDGTYRAPSAYPERALASVSNHDLSPLAGFWTGHDLLLRAEFDLFPSEALHVNQVEQRGIERAALLAALDREGLLPPDTPVDPTEIPHLDGTLRRAVHRYVARAPSRVMMVEPEDVLGQREPMNLPGTTDEHPNWRRRYPLDTAAFGEDPDFRATADALAAEGRGRPAESPVPAAVAAAAPRATYRLQLGSQLTLRDARALVPYLDELGVSHCYLSPVLQARSGSTHGYDVVDHEQIDADIGDRADFEALADALHARGMGVILDIVPNHMGVMGSDNHWWLDVLENGPASRYAHYFDIDWHPARAELAGRVLLPVLGDHYGVVLESGELRLALDPDGCAFAVHYHEHRFPLDPATWPRLLQYWPERLAEALGGDSPALAELRAVAAALEGLPSRSTLDADACAERERIREASRARLGRLCTEAPEIRLHLDAVCSFFNGLAGEAASFEPLHELLEAQAWRLAHWQVAGDEINYRRFFDINDLAGLATENEDVFEATHRLVFELRASGHLDGVRVDHPDGLYEPRAYLRRLAERLEAVAPVGANPAYRVVEKILTGGEALPDDWPVHGTTGYDFTNLVGRLFLDPDGERALTRAYHGFVGQRVSFTEESYRARHLVMRRQMAAELATLANRLDRLSQLDWKTRDFTRNGLRHGLAEVIACFPVYRTYITPERVSAADRATVERAVGAAHARGQVDSAVLEFIADILLLRPGAALVESRRPQLADFVMRFQQYTAALMAKGIEDTALYRHYRLVSLNEVGGNPAEFAADPARVHRALGEKASRWPHAMLATATHDAKRGEDVRARLNALSEIAGDWGAAARDWRRFNRRHRRDAGGRRMPTTNDEYLFYQTVVGAWPPGMETPDAGFAARIRDYMVKAARESKRETSWWRPDEAYETALHIFADGALGDARFLHALAPIRERVHRLGRVNALAQCLIKLTAPGVPDLYQGSEEWQLALVDPDNRQPVDFQKLATGLEAIRAFEQQHPEHESRARLAGMLGSDARGLAKQLLIRRVLAARRRLEPLFRDGCYEAVEVAGERADHIFAFARRRNGFAAVTVVPRLTGALSDGGREPLVSAAWAATRLVLPPDMTGGEAVVDAVSRTTIPVVAQDGGRYTVSCTDLFAALPVALLLPVDDVTAEESAAEP